MNDSDFSHLILKNELDININIFILINNMNGLA